MQLIFNKVKLAVIISFFVISQIDCRMLDVWIGADQTETPDSQYLTITTLFELGFCLKSYPIIATNQLVYNMLKRNLEGKVTISFDDFDIYKSVDNTCYLFIPHSYKTKIESSLPKQFNENLKKYKEGKELISKKTDKEFIKYHQNIIKTLKQYTPEEIAIGFRIDPSSNVLQIVDKKDLRSDKYIASINKREFNLVNSLKKLLVQGKGDFFGLWNVVLEGHGEYPKDVKMNLTMNSIVNQLGQEGNISGRYGMMIAGLWLPQFRDFIQFLTNDIDVNFFYYMTCYSGDLNMILPYITTLLNIRVGLESVKIFGKEETKLIRESIISLKKPNFTIANGALTSKEVSTYGENSKRQCEIISYVDRISTSSDELLSQEKKKEIQEWEKTSQEFMDFKKFFNFLNKYSKDKASNESTVAVKYNNKELKDILNAVTPRYGGYYSEANYFKTATEEHLKEALGNDPYGISGLPSVMFPGTENFFAFALNDEIAVLSNVLVEKYKKENKSFNLEDKKAILIYPREISSEIKIIKKDLPLFPSIVSMVPGLSLHKIDNMKIETLGSDDVKEIVIDNMKIETSGSDDVKEIVKEILNAFIGDSFEKVLPVSPKYFYIKQLSIKKDGVKIVYDNVLIATRVDSVNVIVRNALKSEKTAEIIPSNNFLNSIYNYFVLNPEKAKEFNFDDLKLLLTKEELDILNSAAKKEDIKKEEKVALDALDSETVVLSNVLVEKYKKENKSFNLEDKKSILIYPREISSEIKIIRKDSPLFPSIVSKIPGLSLHKIDDMKIETFGIDDVNKVFNTFLADSFAQVLPEWPKYFYIKKLTITKDGITVVYHNIFIGIRDDSINVIVKKALKSTKTAEIIPSNSFLNSIYNDFVLNPKKAKEFYFDDLKSLLTKEELDILDSAAKKEEIKKEEKPTPEKTQKVEKEEKVTQDKTSKEEKTEKVKIPETKDMTKKKIETSEAKLGEERAIKKEDIKKEETTKKTEPEKTSKEEVKKEEKATKTVEKRKEEERKKAEEARLAEEKKKAEEHKKAIEKAKKLEEEKKIKEERNAIITSIFEQKGYRDRVKKYNDLLESIDAFKIVGAKEEALKDIKLAEAILVGIEKNAMQQISNSTPLRNYFAKVGLYPNTAEAITDKEKKAKVYLKEHFKLLNESLKNR